MARTTRRPNAALKVKIIKCFKKLLFIASLTNEHWANTWRNQPLSEFNECAF
ncbi:hypothetical protein SynA1560_02463 [Synechococcus sp. A15-60]|nr:hypothetical protein SynA1560_02463 [Synechococcus sp. A15-60]